MSDEAAALLAVGMRQLIAMAVIKNGRNRMGQTVYLPYEGKVVAAKDKRIMAAFYGVMPSTVDDSVWGQAMDRGFWNPRSNSARFELESLSRRAGGLSAAE